MKNTFSKKKISKHILDSKYFNVADEIIYYDKYIKYQNFVKINC